MYWALTGREPYPETGNTLQDLHRRMTSSAPPVRQIRPEVPAELSDLVARLMETDPDQRYPSARASRRRSPALHLVADDVCSARRATEMRPAANLAANASWWSMTTTRFVAS